MGITGWIVDEAEVPEPRGTASFTGFMLANRADPGQGRTLGEVLGRAGAVPDRGGPEAQDPDDRMAAMVTRGYSPGLISQLSVRLSDVENELAGERAKLEAGVRRAEQVRQMHEAGRIRAWDIPGMLGDDLGDEGRVSQLQRQAASLRQQIDAASEAIAPPEQRDLDPLEAAAQRAHATFVEVTRARMAEAEAGVRRSGPRPFAGGHGVAVRSEVTCTECVMVGANPQESFLLHADPDAPIETELVGLSEMTVAAWGRQDQAERLDYGQAAITR